jgi:hypothetical protein
MKQWFAIVLVEDSTEGGRKSEEGQQAASDREGTWVS